ncbi:hypothetical protein EJB05_10247, partial [Eragrostis curvula]
MELPSLPLGHRRLLGAADGAGPVVVVGVTVSDAAAMREVLRGDWEVSNAVRVLNSRLQVIPLRRLERADAILSVLENSILPALSAAPTSAVWVKAAKRYAKRLNRQAVGAGGSFYGRAVIVVRCLRNLARDASLIPLRVSDYRLSNRAMRIRDLRSSEVSIALM